MKYETRAGKIEAIRNMPSELAVAVDGLSNEQLDMPYRDGGWTVRQIVHHIADSHLNAFVRMKLILTEDHPTFKPYDQDLWARMNDYTRDITPSVAIISGVQERMAGVLEDASEADLTRTAHHPDNGTMTLQNLLDMYSDHGQHHVDQIMALREKMGW
ncbi:MAG TPA: putative metal-dependent hydrolase [Candidatus Kapabacteria bacterium]|nr:putative metal-dependent hydrolase [Candidatus Kapabacteria bacterium]